MSSNFFVRLLVGISTSINISPKVFADEISETRVSIDKTYNGDKKSDLGIGVQTGNLNGVTGKYWMTETKAIDVGAAFDGSNIAFNADFLYHVRDGFIGTTAKSRQLVPYIGGGIISAFGPSTRIFNNTSFNLRSALRIPIGFEFLPMTMPIGLFAEVVSGIGIAPSDYTYLSADFGGRYYF